MGVMQKEFSTIEGNSKGYYLLLGGLGLLSAGGLFSAYAMFHEGHYITGMNNVVPWGLPISMAVFLIGASAGSLVMSALSSVFGKTEYKPFARISATLAFLLIVGALMCIILDWGRPDRLFVPFDPMNFNPRSMFSWNAILYNTYMGVCLVYLYAMFTENAKLAKIMGGLAVFVAVFVHSGTGAIFGFIHGRELYHSALLPPSFIAAALSSGTGLMILVLLALFRLTGRKLDSEYILGLGKFMAAFIVVVLYLIFIENITRTYGPEFYNIQKFVLLDGFGGLFWFWMIFMGMLVPLAILLYPSTGKSVFWIAVASALTVMGVLVERIIIVIPAQVYPLEQFPGKHVTSVFQDGAFGTYAPTFPEILFVAGLFGVVAFAFVLAIRLFPLMPIEAVIGKKEG